MAAYLSSRGYLSGSGDESVAFGRWLADAAAQQKVPRLEPGVFDVRAVALADVRIEGTPGASTIRLRADADAPLFHAGGRVELVGVVLDGQAAAQTSPKGAGMGVSLILFDGRRDDAVLRFEHCAIRRPAGMVVDCRAELRGGIEISDTTFEDLPEVGHDAQGKVVPSVGIYANQGNGGRVVMHRIRATQSHPPSEPGLAPCLVQVSTNSAAKRLTVDIRDVHAKWYGSRDTRCGMIDLYDSTPDGIIDGIVVEEPGYCLVKAQNAPRLRVGSVKWVGRPLSLFAAAMVDVAAGAHYSAQQSDAPDIGPVSGSGPTGGPVVHVAGSPNYPIRQPHIEVHCTGTRSGVSLYYVEGATVVGEIDRCTGETSDAAAIGLEHVTGASLHVTMRDGAGYGVAGFVDVGGTIEVSGTITGCRPAKIALRNTRPATRFVADHLRCEGRSAAFDIDAAEQEYRDSSDENGMRNSTRRAVRMREARNSWNP